MTAHTALAARVTRWRTAAIALALTAGLATAVSSAADAASLGSVTFEALAAARAGTAAYHRISVAEADGFGRPPAPEPAHYCIASLTGPGAMGHHFVNGSRVGDAAIDESTPEILVYEPSADGTLQLVAAEYIVFQEVWDAAHPGVWPSLFGQPLHLVPAPNRYEIPSFYEIHAWIWRHNPSGMFEDFNPLVSCEHALP
jgi:hypothetical protein